MTDIDLVERLREVASLRTGDKVPPSLVDEHGNYAGGITDLLNEAIKEIEHLRQAHKPKGKK